MNQYLYLILDLGSLSIPLLYSVFEKKFHFIQFIKASFFSILFVAIPFLIWDVLFTKYGIWGFNSDYHLSIKFFNMPLEEWLFFFCIPYACLFTHEGIKYYFPNLKLSKSATLIIGSLLVLTVSLLLVQNFGKWYTTINFSLFLLLILYSLKYQVESLRVYLPSFLIILIPFTLVNGVLTGSYIENPVVWYNNNEYLGYRILTIPLEDVFYAFTMLFSVQLIFNRLKKFYKRKQ